MAVLAFSRIVDTPVYVSMDTLVIVAKHVSIRFKNILSRRCAIKLDLRRETHYRVKLKLWRWGDNRVMCPSYVVFYWWICWWTGVATTISLMILVNSGFDHVWSYWWSSWGIAPHKLLTSISLSWRGSTFGIQVRLEMKMWWWVLSLFPLEYKGILEVK